MLPLEEVPQEEPLHQPEAKTTDARDAENVTSS